MTDTITTLSVRGMSCQSCVRHVEAAVRAVPGVVAVAVDLAGASVRVTHVPDVDVDAIVAAIDEAGYEAGGGATARV
jgi:copper chaperone